MFEAIPVQTREGGSERRTRSNRVLLVFSAAALVSACTLFPSAKDRAMRNSPSFKQGYSDGCAAATTASSNYREGPYRDQALYQSDAAYRAGWANGYQSCRPLQPNGGAVPGSSVPGTPPTN